MFSVLPMPEDVMGDNSHTTSLWAWEITHMILVRNRKATCTKLKEGVLSQCCGNNNIMWTTESWCEWQTSWFRSFLYRGRSFRSGTTCQFQAYPDLATSDMNWHQSTHVLLTRISTHCYSLRHCFSLDIAKYCAHLLRIFTHSIELCDIWDNAQISRFSRSFNSTSQHGHYAEVYKLTNRSSYVDCRLIPIEFSLFYMSYGPCGYFGATACYLTYSVMLCGADCAVRYCDIWCIELM